MKITTWIDELRQDPVPRLGESGLLGKPYANALKVFCLAALVVLPVLQAFRGLDLTDTGFVATSQRFIFTDPAHVSYWFHIWLANILGGLVDLVFGAWGLLPMKLAAAAIFWATTAAGFKLFKTAMPRELIWIGVTVTIGFGFVDKINIIHYNNLSAMFMALGAWLLVDGCTSRRRGLLFVAGFVLGLNTLARLPNALGLGLMLIPLILDAAAAGRSVRLRPDRGGLLLYAAGAVAALGVGFAVMAALGHLPLYIKSLKDLGGPGSADASNYRAAAVFVRPARDAVYALVLGPILLCGTLALSTLTSLLRSRIARVCVVVLVGVLLCVAFFLGVPADPTGRMANRMIAGVGYIAAIAAAFFLTAPGDSRLRAGSVMAASVVLVLSIGSDTGIKVSTYAFPLMAPGILGVLYRIGRVRAGEGRGALLPLTAAFLAVLLGAFTAYGLAEGIYRDTSRMVRTVKHPMLAGIFTSPARAQALEEALPEIALYAPPGSVLFAFDSLGLIHFATRTKPYLDNPWPALYSVAELETKFREKEASLPLPVIVLAKSNARSSTWPLNSVPPVGLAPVRSFIERHGYALKWQNNALIIYLPPETKK